MFFTLPNNTSIVTTTLPVPPWEYTATQLPSALRAEQSKTAYRAWCTNPSTKHAFISCVEAMDPGRRASWEDGNPPVKVHGVIVDYDADNRLTEEDVQQLRDGKTRWPSEFAPQWVADSYTTGHLRVLWLFEQPVLVASDKHYTKLMQILDKKVRFNKWFSGFEAEALGDSCKYYMIGDNYRPIKPDAVIPKNLLDLWSFEAARMVQDTLVERRYEIPLEQIEAEVKAKYPDKWTGPFEVGARGLRFWDPSAKDTTGAMVLNHGMLAFSGEQAFVPWVKILGTAFVEKFEADKISKVMDRLVLEHKQGAASSSYWVDHQGSWKCMNTGQVKMWLECQGFSDARPKNGTASEITRVLNEIHLNKSVHGAFPYIHYPHGVIDIDGKRVLNTSTVQALAPAPEGVCKTLTEGRTYFPTIWSFLSGFFEQVPTDSRSPNIQLEFFLSWLRHAYKLYYKQTPQPGLILILVGPQSAGKSFLLQKIMARMLGGSHDMKDILASNGGKYTDLLTQTPIAYIDDMSEITDREQHTRYSERIKGLVSNHKVTFDGKWKSTGETLWYGRIVICMNDDASSLRMLPDMSLSMAGKVSMLMVNRRRDDGHRFNADWAETDKKIKAELPFFCRWLLDGWEAPDYLENRSNPRYFLVPYKHPELYQEAHQRGSKHELYEILREFVDDMKQSNESFAKTGWSGSTTALFALLSAGKMDSVMRKWNASRLGTSLGLLISATNITRVKTGGNQTAWHIPASFDYVDQAEFGERIITAAEDDDEQPRLAADATDEKKLAQRVRQAVALERREARRRKKEEIRQMLEDDRGGESVIEEARQEREEAARNDDEFAHIKPAISAASSGAVRVAP